MITYTVRTYDAENDRKLALMPRFMIEGDSRRFLDVTKRPMHFDTVEDALAAAFEWLEDFEDTREITYLRVYAEYEHAGRPRQLCTVTAPRVYRGS